MVPIDGKLVFKIVCEKSLTYVLLKHKGKEEFYIRSGPSAQLLSASEMIEYVQTHFSKITNNPKE
jgi:hypothetical protein